jgi:hypothetical protein
MKNEIFSLILRLTLAALILMLTLSTIPAFAGSGKSAVAQAPQKNLKKEMYFKDQLVNGKFQLPGDSAIEIENEKPVFNLLQIRADFNDRRLRETTRDL